MNVCWGCSIRRFQKAIKIWSLSCGPTYSSLLLHCWFTDWTLQHPPVLSLVASILILLFDCLHTFIGDTLPLPKLHARTCDSSSLNKNHYMFFAEAEIQKKSSYDCWPHQLAAFLLRCVWPLVTLLWRDRCETGKEIDICDMCSLKFGSHTTAPWQWQRDRD